MKLNMAYLDKGSNDTQTGKAEILKWSSFAHRVKKWVQEQGNVDWKQKYKYHVTYDLG